MVPLDLPINRTPALLGLQQPDVWNDPFVTKLVKRGTSTLVFHTQKWKSYTVKMMSSLDGIRSKATTGLKLLYWFQKPIIVSFLLPASSADLADQSHTNN